MTDIKWTKKEESLVLSPCLEVISHLNSLAKKKIYYWVRNIAKLGKNSLSREVTWTSCYITRAEPLNIMFVALTRVIYISSELNKLRISKVAHFVNSRNKHTFRNPSTSLNFDTLKKFKRTSMKIWPNIFDCRPLNPFNTVLGSNHVATA